MGIVKRFQGNMECPYAKLLATFTIHTCILSHDEMINKFDQALSALPHDTSMVEEVMHKCNLQLENDQEFSIPAFCNEMLKMAWYVALETIHEFQQLAQKTNKDIAISVFTTLSDYS